MKYGIVENHKFVLIDDDLQRLKNTLPFMPKYSLEQLKSYQGSEVEQGHDGNWYEKGHAPQKPLDELKAEKLAELNDAFEKASREAHCLSVLGFEIDADETANRNIEGLTLVLKPGESTLFRAYDNSFHSVSREQLETMRREIVVNSQWLYQAKWTLENRVSTAEAVEALQAIMVSPEALAELAGVLRETTAGEGNG